MQTSEMSAVRIGFVIAWATLAMAGVGFFQQGSNANLKRRWYPWYISLSWVVVVSYLCYFARFCEVCGAPSRKKKVLFNKPMSCSRCGACFHGW